MIADLQKVIEAAKLAGIHDTIMRLPERYDTPVPSGGFGFSRGFRQRLGLARAFFGDPRLVVLDEPNASLDYVGERVLLDAIERMKAANTHGDRHHPSNGYSRRYEQDCHHAGWRRHRIRRQRGNLREAFKPTSGSVAGYSAREHPHGRENVGGASCPVTWKPQDTQASSPDPLRERRLRGRDYRNRRIRAA